ncbi:hypothetical protein GGR51DRAFT_311757 [Nemania sp. FL0031]|nr:hypothetical protein GGR51DRAFT_311757 [Nemania sp. FL0031]
MSATRRVKAIRHWFLLLCVCRGFPAQPNPSYDSSITQSELPRRPFHNELSDRRNGVEIIARKHRKEAFSSSCSVLPYPLCPYFPFSFCARRHGIP